MVVAVPKGKADGAASCAEAVSGSVHETHPIDATVASADFDLAQYRHRPAPPSQQRSNVVRTLSLDEVGAQIGRDATALEKYC